MAYLVGPLVRSTSSSTPRHRGCLLMHSDLADVDLALDAHNHQDAPRLLASADLENYPIVLEAIVAAAGGKAKARSARP